MHARTIYYLIAAVSPSITFGITGLADIELVPNPPPPYVGGESLTVDVWLHSNDVSSHDLRSVQLDIRAVPTSVRLIAGGAFTQAGSANALRIAELKDGQWAPIGADGSGALQPVLAIAQFDDGSGPALYFGGAFDEVQDCDGCPLIQANHIIKWDGASFQPVGNGLSSKVRALAVHDDGSGAALYAGGNFVLSAPGVWSSRIAKWDGVAWQPVGLGLNSTVRALGIHDEGASPFLVAGGSFWHAVWEPMRSIAKWTGVAFNPVGDELIQDVYTLTVYDDGGGEALYAGGLFSESLTQPLSRVAKLQGNSWQPLGGGVDGYGVLSSTVFNTVGGDVLVVGGLFHHAGGIPVNNIAQWDGTTWSALGDGIDGPIVALATFDDGTGTALFAGGDFRNAGGNPRRFIAKWDGGVWSSAGGDFDRDVLELSVVSGPDILRSLNFDFAPDFAAYFECSSLPTPSVVSTSASPGPGMVSLDALGSVYIGTLSIDLPTELGTYLLDVMNAGENRPDLGARVGFGFGTAGDEPVTTWSAETGELTGGSLLLDVGPYEEDFEAGLGAWTNAGGDVFDWTRDSGGTPSFGTGPSGDHTTGTGWYMYIETSSPRVAGDTAILEIPCFDLGGVSGADLSFWYHMNGSAIGTLNVDVATDCSVWTNIWTLSGSQGDVWTQATVDLDAYAGTTIKVRFVGVRGSSWAGDIAIDDVSLDFVYPCTRNAECEDGLFCNGQEVCNAGTCEPAPSGGVTNGTFDGSASWTDNIPSDGSITYGGNLNVVGPDGGSQAFTWSSQSDVVVSGANLEFDLLSYASSDTGSWDYPVFYLNGTYYGINSNGTLGAATTGGSGGAGSISNGGQTSSTIHFVVDIDALAGGAGPHTIGFGVNSVDGVFGAGTAVFDNVMPAAWSGDPCPGQTCDELNNVCIP